MQLIEEEIDQGKSYFEESKNGGFGTFEFPGEVPKNL